MLCYCHATSRWLRPRSSRSCSMLEAWSAVISKTGDTPGQRKQLLICMDAFSTSREVTAALDIFSSCVSSTWFPLSEAIAFLGDRQIVMWRCGVHDAGRISGRIFCLLNVYWPLEPTMAYWQRSLKMAKLAYEAIFADVTRIIMLSHAVLCPELYLGAWTAGTRTV